MLLEYVLFIMYTIYIHITGYVKSEYFMRDLGDFLGYFWLYVILGLHAIFRM
jgi:hypothetical protein